jgi:hypothetical protein
MIKLCLLIHCSRISRATTGSVQKLALKLTVTKDLITFKFSSSVDLYDILTSFNGLIAQLISIGESSTEVTVFAQLFFDLMEQDESLWSLITILQQNKSFENLDDDYHLTRVQRFLIKKLERGVRYYTCGTNVKTTNNCRKSILRTQTQKPEAQMQADTKKEKRCRACNSFGHTSWNCPYRTKLKCSKCGYKYHNAEACNANDETCKERLISRTESTSNQSTSKIVPSDKIEDRKGIEVQNEKVFLTNTLETLSHKVMKLFCGS